MWAAVVRSPRTIELPHNFLLLSMRFGATADRHYLVSDGPQLVLRPNAAGTDVYPSMVHAGAGSPAWSGSRSKKSAFAVYYGEDYFGRNFFPGHHEYHQSGHDHRVWRAWFAKHKQPRHSANTRSIGCRPSGSTDKYGALQYYTQYSYVSSHSVVCRSGRG